MTDTALTIALIVVGVMCIAVALSPVSTWVKAAVFAWIVAP